VTIFVLASYVNAHCLQVERLPLPGESLRAGSRWAEHGGKGFNVGLGAHRLDMQVDMLLPLGADAIADSVLQLLHDEGLDSRWALKVGEQSGFGVGFVAANGDNFLAIYPGANALLTAEHVEQTMTTLPPIDLVYGQFEIPEAPILAAFRRARLQGIRTMLNPSPWRLPNAELLALTDILIINETEAALLFEQEDTGHISPEQWLSRLPSWAKQSGWQGKWLVVTLGEQGCVALTPAVVIHQSAWPIVATDATGAGDAFSAGLAAALLQGLDPDQALKLACACGAWVAGKQGVLQALPTLSEVCLFMQTHHHPPATIFRLTTSSG
jgi:ribokinase